MWAPQRVKVCETEAASAEAAFKRTVRRFSAIR